MTANPLRSGTPPLPALRLPVGRQRLAAGAALSFLAHAALIAGLVIWGVALRQRAPGSPDRRGGGARGSGRPAMNFFTLATAAPAPVDVPAAPRLRVSDLAALRRIPVELPPVQLPREAPPVAVEDVMSAAAGVGGQGRGAGGAPGAGLGAGAGAGAGPGMGGEGGYIFVASPRTAILPPLAKVPGSVAGRTYRVTFWVAADGRVTRVEVDPPIADAEYSREFQQRMMAYQFYPARTRDGRSVASVVAVPLRIGQ